MIKFIKNIIFPPPPPPPDPQLVAAHELNDARMDLLNAQKEHEYWQSMVPMLHGRIARLTKLASAEVQS